jgi:hypothetical protein
MLQFDDQALAATMEWARKHQSKSWQVEVITPEADGKWFVGDLKPGWYEIVVRARFGSYDAKWQGNIQVQPGQTFTPPQQPSLIYKIPN